MIQYLIYIGLLVVAFLIPNVFYEQGFVHVARVVSGIFLFFSNCHFN